MSRTGILQTPKVNVEILQTALERLEKVERKIDELTADSAPRVCVTKDEHIGERLVWLGLRMRNGQTYGPAEMLQARNELAALLAELDQLSNHLNEG